MDDGRIGSADRATRASPEPLSTQGLGHSASVPCAERILTLPWRPMDTFPRDGSINAVIFYPWNVKTNDPRIQMAQWLDLYGDGGKLCGPWDYNNKPFAEAWLSFGELNSALRAASAIEGRKPRRRVPSKTRARPPKGETP